MSTHTHRLVSTGLRGWLILFALWTVPPVLVAGTFYVVLGGAVGWPRLLMAQLVFYYPLAAMSPLIYRAIGRFPFTRPGWPLAVVVQGLLAVGLLAIEFVASTLFDLQFGASTTSLFPPGEGTLASRFDPPNALYFAFIILFNYLLTASALTAVFLGRARNRERDRQRDLEIRAARLETLLTTANLQALNAQLQPHFLFNALNGALALIQVGRNDEAYTMLARLGDLLRATLDVPQGQSLSLERELALVRLYLNIEQVRFSDRLQVEFDVAPDCLDVPVPGLILQPLVENAIRHAVSRDEDAGSLRISAQRRNGRLQLDVRDDGPGFPAGWTLASGDGIGLRNVHERLRTLYGDEGALNIESGDPRGAVVSISMPLSVRMSEKGSG